MATGPKEVRKEDEGQAPLLEVHRRDEADRECNGYFNYGTYGGVPVTPDELIPDEAPDFSEDILNINNIRPL